MKLIFEKRNHGFGFGLFNQNNFIRHNRIGVLWFEKLKVDPTAGYFVIYGYSDTHSSCSFSLWLTPGQACRLIFTGQVEL